MFGVQIIEIHKFLMNSLNISAEFLISIISLTTNSKIIKVVYIHIFYYINALNQNVFKIVIFILIQIIH